ncbi:hypothetical protein BGW80DRAFT_1278236 [Lactifluus volemus]|nr:hypothetical protein BGW80DRAFT_1278236 [Lactifluus volemus]
MSTLKSSPRSQCCLCHCVQYTYPLGPRGLLTTFRTQTYQRTLKDLVRDPRARVLLCFGDEDNFTGVEAFNEWAQVLASALPPCNTVPPIYNAPTTTT